MNAARPALDDELASVVREIRHLSDSGAYSECLELISERLVEAWFGFEPQELVGLVRRLVAAEGAGESGRMILDFMNSLGGPAYALGTHRSGDFLNLPADVVALLGRMIHFRHQGMSREAHRIATEIEKQEQVLPLFYDSGWGMRQVVEVQSGISAMLAGEFDDALRYFVSAQLIRPIPSLRLLSRDAYVKAALVHALFGDLAEARTLLAQADTIPRTSSWAEAGIDASAAIAQAILAIEDEDQTARDVMSIPLHHVGEMWPFYVVAIQRTYERRGLRPELIKRLQRLQKIPLPRVEGEGFTGSVFPLALATVNLADGNLGKAREQLAFADPSYVGTKLLELLQNLLQGELDSVVSLSYSLRREILTLRQMDIFREAITATAHLAKGDTDNAVAILQSVARTKGGLTKVEMSYFGENLRELAQREVPEWPPTEAVDSAFIADLKFLRTALTEREVETIRLLSQGCSREEIAARMYVSVNTVKTHLSSIYRKFGVRNRSGATAEAASRGLI